MLIEYNLSETV